MVKYLVVTKLMCNFADENNSYNVNYYGENKGIAGCAV